MNKGVVIELVDDAAIIMSEDGRFLKVNAFKGLYQGMEMVYNDMDIIRTKNTIKKAKSNFAFRFSQLAAAVVLGFALLSGSYIYYDYNFAIYASVTLDVNPSMQLDIGKKSQIVNVEELNLDAEKLLEGLKLNGQSVDQAISEVENRLKEKGYFETDQENFMLLGYMNVNGKMDMKDLKKKVENSAIKEAGASKILLQVKSVNVNPALAKKTTKKTKEKVSAGKQTYVNQLKDQGIIDKNTNVYTAKIPALFESQNIALKIDPSAVTAVAPAVGEPNVVVTISEVGLVTPTPSSQPGATAMVKEGEKIVGASTTSINPNIKSSESKDSTVTITIIPNDKITPIPTPVDTGAVKSDKTIDNNKYNSKTIQSVTLPISVVPVDATHIPTATTSPVPTSVPIPTPTSTPAQIPTPTVTPIL